MKHVVYPAVSGVNNYVISPAGAYVVQPTVAGVNKTVGAVNNWVVVPVRENGAQVVSQYLVDPTKNYLLYPMKNRVVDPVCYGTKEFVVQPVASTCKYVGS